MASLGTLTVRVDLDSAVDALIRVRDLAAAAKVCDNPVMLLARLERVRLIAETALEKARTR